MGFVRASGAYGYAATVGSAESETGVVVPCLQPVQLIDCSGQGGIIRCSRCKAYMNPYVRWTGVGRSWQCNFCNASNPTPEGYFAPLRTDGRRYVAAVRYARA